MNEKLQLLLLLSWILIGPTFVLAAVFRRKSFRLVIGQKWNIGGCTGTVTVITTEHFYVSGTYRYSDFLAEDWTACYRRDNLPAKPKVWYKFRDNPSLIIYDASEMPVEWRDT